MVSIEDKIAGIDRFCRRITRQERRARAYGLCGVADLLRSVRRGATHRRRDRTTNPLLPHPPGVSDLFIDAIQHVLATRVEAVTGVDRRRRSTRIHALVTAALADLRASQAGR